MFGLWELVNLLWLKNINKEGMAMLEMKYDRTIDVIKGYVDVNDDVENETMKYLGVVMDRKTKE